jgi:endonuclease III
MEFMPDRTIFPGKHSEIFPAIFSTFVRKFENSVRREERFRHVIEYFLKTRSEATTELVFRNPYELAVAVILSAQCTDKRVNIITPAFFKKFPDPVTLAHSNQEDVYQLIRSCTYPNNKSKSLIGMAKMLTEKYNGILPSEIDELLTLPGVGRKTANVLAAAVYNKPTMAVDTHVFRVAARIGLTVNAKTPLQTEMQLVRYIPEELIPLAHHWLILHGRYVCVARKPKCTECGLTQYCKYFSKHPVS